MQSLFADGAGEAENLKNLAEALNINFRSFIKNATSFEESRKNLEREDILANLEISLLRLVRNLRNRKKRIRVRNIQCRDGVKKRKLACPHCDATFTAVSPKSLQQHVRSAHPKMPKLSIHQLPQEDKIKCLLKNKYGEECGKLCTRDALYRHLSSEKCHLKPSNHPKGSKFWGFKVKEKENQPTEAIWIMPGEPEPHSEDEEEDDDENEEVSVSAETTVQVQEVKAEEVPVSAATTGQNNAIEQVSVSKASSIQVNYNENNGPANDHDQRRANDEPNMNYDNLGEATEDILAENGFSNENDDENCVQFDPNSTLFIITNRDPKLSETMTGQQEEGAVLLEITNTPVPELPQLPPLPSLPSLPPLPLLPGPSAMFNASVQEEYNPEPENDLVPMSSPDFYGFQNSGNLTSEEYQRLILSTKDKVVESYQTNLQLYFDTMSSSQDSSQGSLVTKSLDVPSIWHQVADEVGFDQVLNLELQKEDEIEDIDHISLEGDFDEELCPDFDADDQDLEAARERKEREEVRLKNRDILEETVDLQELPENSNFIANFSDWLKSTTNLDKKTDKNVSTIDLTLGHLFHYFDSFLSFMKSQNSSFNLTRLTEFKNPQNMLLPKSPVEWIKAAKGNPCRALQQLRAHKKLREYLEYRLLTTDFSGQEIITKLGISTHLKDIDNEIANLKLYSKLNKLYNRERERTKKMKEVIKPGSNEAEYNSVEVWFASPEAKSIEKEVRDIYERAMKTKKIKPGEFNTVSNAVRFAVALKDKNRVSCYFFTNEDYLSKKKSWLPEGFNSWYLEALPPNWKMYEAPADNVPPTNFEIRLDGSLPGIKNQRKTNVMIDRHSFELCEMFKDLKELVFDGEMNPNDAFFVNFRGKPLSRLQKQKGSLVSKLAEVTGNDDFTMTSVRRGLEGRLQNDPQQAGLTKDVNNHSTAVVPTYDNMAPSRRNLFMHSLANAEGSSLNPDHDENFKNMYEKSLNQERNERMDLQKGAKKYIDDKKKNRGKVTDLGPSPLETEDIEFLKTVFSQEDAEGEID